MYNHSNASQVSSGSARRISSNNPFRSALLQDEQRSRSRQNLSSPQEDQEYSAWLDRRVQEEAEGYSSDNSFEAGDELDFAPPRPRANRADSGPRSSSNSRGGSRRSSNNPFAKQEYREEHAAPPPAYHDIVPKGAQKDYPKDEKTETRTSVREVDENPFPETRRAPPPAPGRPHRSDSGANKLNVETLTNTTTTKIYPDGRVRSKSTGDPISDHHRSQRRERGERGERSERRGERGERSDRDHSDRPHRSQSHSHGGHRSSRRSKRFVQEKSRQVDTIDRLDVTGFFGGAKFHHDGPFDACTPQRNKDKKAAPVAAFPADGPNSSIKGTQPVNVKEDQYDMMFGVNTVEKHDARTETKEFQRESSVDSVAGALGKARISQFDVTNAKKLAGEESLGLGSTTFVDGAPVYGQAAASSEKEGGLGRKKTLLGRMKTIVRK